MPTLSEAQSKRVLAGFGVPFPAEQLVNTATEAAAAAVDIGMPVAVKLTGADIAHKTERGFVRLHLMSAEAVEAAATALLDAATPEDGDVQLLVAPMVAGHRELIAGLHRDETFGPVVLLGVGGVLAEAVDDVVCRLVPITPADAAEMIDDLRSQRLLGPCRGEPPVDRAALAEILLALSRAGESDEGVVSVDLNPLIVRGGEPIPVDALVELRGAVAAGGPDESRGAVSRSAAVRASTAEQFRALVEPRGVVVAGVSEHPGKFGFAVLHHILLCGYQGEVHALGRQPGQVLGVPVMTDVDDLPDGAIDLVYVCSPAGTVPDLLRACAKKGIRAAFIASAGFSEAGEDGQRAETELAQLADELGLLVVGPNGMGIVSTPVRLCAQLQAPYPPAGRIGVVSQSGNFVMACMNYALASGVGISRAVSAGNAQAAGIDEFLTHLAADDATDVSLTYLEGVTDGRRFFDRLRAATALKPVVVVKGGVTADGARAARSHTGALAHDATVFEGLCRQAGATRARTVEEGFEAAATFTTQPLPAGPRTVVLTLAGGWGVLAADAIASTRLQLIPLPDSLRTEIDARVPPRWSRANPVDLAGGETRDTVTEVLELITAHADVDAVIFVGFGIQSNTAKMIRTSPFFPDHGLDRIVGYHERQDVRYGQAAAAVSEGYGKPVLCVTELAVTDPTNGAPATVRETGRLCYPSINRAVTALDHLWRYAQYRGHGDGPLSTTGR